jgi:hypothetical protein
MKEVNQERILISV